MTKKEVMGLLYDYCCWVNIEKIKKLFIKYPHDINLAKDRGLPFRLAMLHESVETLKV